MKILLTGGTGFLGKYLLNLLVGDERVTRVDVLTRSKTTHPHPKVRVIQGDLSLPSSVHVLPEDADLVIHLAGLYDFRESFARNYSENVLSTLNLLAKIRAWNETRRVPLLYASSYAVQFAGDEGSGERPLVKLPPKEISYAYTKAVAERAVSDSGIPGMAFRIGVLVGASTGEPIEKMDGPYALLQAIASAVQLGLKPALRFVPIPGKREAILPLVPVDVAARAFHRAVFQDPAGFCVYGLYDPASVSVQEFCETIVPRILPGAELSYFEKVPPSLLALQAAVTGIPAEVFRFSLEKIPLSNDRFRRDFPDCAIPAFASYADAFLRGFTTYQKGQF